MISRRHARRIALQILFANEFLKEDVQTVSRRVLESLEEKPSNFTMELVEKTARNKDELDRLIEEHLKNWDLSRIAVLDRVLIRMALAEMLYFPDIPVEVTINEALEIGKDFCNLKSRRFINGILDSIYKDLRKRNVLIKKLEADAKHRSGSEVKKGNLM
ncbi:MAG: transcription antitermination factor NusB [Calditrichaeota bacterium]|nr:transcription antitermination factor NusB [Calditrichota bacterium]